MAEWHGAPWCLAHCVSATFHFLSHSPSPRALQEQLFGFARQGATGAAGLFAAGIDGIFLLAFPALLSAIGLFIMRRKAIFRRSVFLALLTIIVYGLFYLASIALAGTWQPAKNLAYVGFASAFVLWYFTLLLAFDFRQRLVLRRSLAGQNSQGFLFCRFPDI